MIMNCIISFICDPHGMVVGPICTYGAIPIIFKINGWGMGMSRTMHFVRDNADSNQTPCRELEKMFPLYFLIIFYKRTCDAIMEKYLQNLKR